MHILVGRSIDQPLSYVCIKLEEEELTFLIKTFNHAEEIFIVQVRGVHSLGAGTYAPYLFLDLTLG